MEEIDLCWRIHRAGYDIKVVPSSVVYHLGAGTLLKSNPRKTFLNFRNSLAMLVRNETGTLKTFFLVFFRMCLDGLAGLQFLAKGESKNTRAIIEAHGAFYQWLPRLIQERKALHKTLKHKASSQVKWPIFLIANYFILGKKKFSDYKTR
jgi:GT2 family glycosyltransferase